MNGLNDLKELLGRNFMFWYEPFKVQIPPKIATYYLRTDLLVFQQHPNTERITQREANDSRRYIPLRFGLFLQTQENKDNYGKWKFLILRPRRKALIELRNKGLLILRLKDYRTSLQISFAAEIHLNRNQMKGTCRSNFILKNTGGSDYERPNHYRGRTISKRAECAYEFQMQDSPTELKYQ